MALFRAVAHAQHPLTAVAEMVAHLLQRLGRNRRQRFEAAFLQRFVLVIAECVEEELPHDGIGVIAVGLFQQQQVAKIDRFPEIGQFVFIAALSFYFSGQSQETDRLPHAVEGDIGDGDILFQDRPMPAPFREAVPQDQAVISQAEQVVEYVIPGLLIKGICHQNTFTPRGTL